MTKRISLAILTITVIVGLVAATVAYTAARKTVTVSVDGKSHRITTLDDTVGDVLASENIALGARDVVAPAADTSLDEGTRIAVSYGRKLTLDVDGKNQTYWTTATRVNDALSELGQRFEAGAELSASRSTVIGRKGLKLAVNTPKTITLKVGGGNAKRATTTGLDVSEALLDLGVRVDHNDEVTPKRTSSIDDGSKIVVTRIWGLKRTVPETVPYATVVHHDASMYTGQSKIVRDGKAGTDKVTYKIVKTNGKVTRKRVVKRVTDVAPVSRIEAEGTKSRPAPAPAPTTAPSTNYATGSTVWDQIAQCESGGNWAIDTGNGYYGGLQFLQSTWLAYGGGAYASLPSQASREAQIAIATKVRDASGGYSPWPACASSLGLL